MKRLLFGVAMVYPSSGFLGYSRLVLAVAMQSLGGRAVRIDWPIRLRYAAPVSNHGWRVQ